MFLPAKKSLGQNFLSSPAILDKIVSAARLTTEDIVLEVGPGQGSLTEKLLQTAKKVIAIEKDDRLIPILQEKFAREISDGKFELVHGDVLDFKFQNSGLQTTNYKLIANIPYYLTGQIFRKFLESERQPSLIVLMLQKEVVERIVSQKGSILSISVQIYGKPKYIATVKKSFFKPRPRVDSAILLIDEISNPFKEKSEQEKFFSILKTGFAQKRKKLFGNLKKNFDGKNLEKAFKTCGLGENVRAEELELEKWKCLAENFN